MDPYLLRSIKTVNVLAAADGDNVVIAAPGVNKYISVIGYKLRYIGTGAVTIKDGAGNVFDLVDAAAAPGNSAIYVGVPESPAFTGAVNQSIVINNAAGVDSIGHMTYRIANVTGP